MPSTGLDLLGSTRRLLLTAVKKHGSVSVEVLAQETFLTASAVRQHLMALASHGTVQYTEKREGPGRPKHLFSLTAQGEALFPQRYDSLSELIMSALEEEDQGVIDRVLGRVSDMAFARESQRLKDTSGWERVEAMTAVMEDMGYFPSLVHLPDGRARLALLHCPLKNVAAGHPGVCWSEQRALSMALGQELTRDEHRLDGAAACAYIINAPEASAG
jgi:predicted ArsR family transcriptional regulator